MKCRNCDADLAEGVIKCPFCKELVINDENSMFENFNFKYTITSEEQLNAIREAANQGSSSVGTVIRRKSGKKVVLRKIRRNKKEKKSFKFSGLSAQNKMYVAFYGGIILLIALITGIIFGVGAIVNRERTINPIVYTKGNSMYLVCDRKNVLLTENAIDKNSVFSSLDGDEAKQIAEILEKSNVIKNSENGMYTYYFENYDATSNSGSLNRIFNGRKKRAISNSVHNSYLLSPDGKSVLFLQSADKNGDMGSLCYWNEDMKEPVRIASDIDKNTFVFSKNGRYVLYIRNYSYSDFGGDLCVLDTENISGESIMIDSEVYAVFGSDKNEDNFIYGKDYNKEKSIYNIYMKNQKSERVKVFEGAAKKPILPEKGNILVTYAYGDGKMYSLYNVNLKNFDKTKIASQTTTVVKTDEENKTILFNKVYDNYITDCYLYTRGQKTVKIADNVVPAPKTLSGANLFSYCDDLSRAVYISGFDKSRYGGILYLTDTTKGSDDIGEISSDVYMCRISPDGKKVIYAKDYSPERDIFDLYEYSKGRSTLLREEVDASYFGVSKDRSNYFGMENYDMTGPYGVLNVYNTNNKQIGKFENVWAYDRYGDKGIIFFTDYNTAEETWRVNICNGRSKRAKTIDSGIDAVIYY